MTTRPAIFKWRQTEPQLILCAVRWYLRYSLSLRDVEELLEERCLEADHTTIWRWVQRYGPELDHRLRRHLDLCKSERPLVLSVSIQRLPPLTFCCRRYAMPMRPNSYFARL